MNSLTLIERMVLESLGVRAQDVASLTVDTGLQPRIVINVLRTLSSRSLVSVDGGTYSLNPHLPSQELAALNSKESALKETQEILIGLARQTECRIKLRKAWITEKDAPILKAMLKNVENFMQTLPAPSSGTNIKDYTLVLWGEGRYGDVTQKIVEGEIPCV